jgi:hypothetical protein
MPIARPTLPLWLLLLPSLALLSACSKSRKSSATPTTETSTATAQASPAAGKKIDYRRDIQPILSNYCYHCHGPDTATREPKAMPLRLDIRDKALAYVNDDGVKTIVPGNPDKSELVRRVESHDPEEMMPQDKEKLLSPDQIKLLREWIKQGAEFRDHWAFEKPVKSPLPAVSDEKWSKNEVDRFILAKLDAEGIKPNPEADRRALIRRVTLDLIGLLPTPEETAAFVNDPAPTDAAYEKVVDRLLASSKYGEQRGRYWLDYARYSDTHGIHVDPYRSIWPYRDYVIKSLNDNKPFDRFITEQLAGDLLPDCTQDTLVASAFVRAGPSTGEGGTIVEENWNNLIRERTEAFGVTLMGMTTACAVCHDHKYDPLTASDFYSLAAFFGNQTEKSWTADQHYWPPYQVLPREENRPAFEAALAKRAKAESQLRDLAEQESANIAAWLKTGLKPVREGLVGWLPLDENKGDTVRERVSNQDLKCENSPPVWDTYPHVSGSFLLNNNTRLSSDKLGDFEKDQPFTISGWFRTYEVVSHNNGFGNNSGCMISRMDGANLRGWDLFIENNRLVMHMIGEKWPTDAIKVQGDIIPRPEWTHITATYDGSGKAAGIKLYREGKPMAMSVANDTLTGSIKTPTPLNLGRRGGDESSAVPSRQNGFQDLRFYNRALSPEEITRLPRENALAEILAKKPDYLTPADIVAARRAHTSPFDKAWTPFEKKAAQEAYFAAHPEKTAALQKDITDAQAQMKAQSEAKPNSHPNIGDVAAALQSQYEGKTGALTLVSRERETPAAAHLLTRGDYTARAERVYPDTPSFLPPMPKGAPANRLGLAQWTLSPENPLLARVTVNRAWQELFGLGLVETAEDFGIVGSQPSHPELLDNLAVTFRDGENGGQGKWDMKRLYKKLVMSATYRQSSAISKPKLEKDPKNEFLARGPRQRMDAEMVRDCALQAGGILNTDKLGGPSFLGYLPAGVLSSVYPSNTTTGAQHHGPMLYRRSMYRFIKRMVSTPEMEAFDGTDRIAACARRNRTNTPLAALTLMNDVTFLEAARGLAQKALQEAGATDDARLAYMADRVLCRPLSSSEKTVLLKVLAKQSKEMTPERAKTLLSIGEMPRDEKLDPVTHANWMLVASTLMNADEAITK